MIESVKLPFVAKESNFAAYARSISKIPILSQKVESQLIYSWIKNKSLSAAHQLVTSHLKLVVKIALRYRNYGLPLMDIISEGNIGLMKAVKKFRPEKGNRLSTYAMWWIKASIQNYIVKSWSIVKIGSGILQEKLFSGISNNRKKSSSILENSYNTVSLNEKLGAEVDTEFMDTISDNAESHEENIANQQIKDHRMALLDNAINSLNKREQDIIKHRKLSESPSTLHVLSKKYSVSSERIRQIEESALKKIRYFTHHT